MQNEYKKLFARGGVSLTLGALAILKKDEPKRWNALAPFIAHPANEIVDSIINIHDQEVLASSIKVAMSDELCSHAPKYVKKITADNLEAMGDFLKPQWPLGSKGRYVTGRQGAVYAFAIAFCRNIDVIKDVAAGFGEEGLEMIRAAGVAALTAPPGLPSSTKRAIRTFTETGLL